MEIDHKRGASTSASGVCVSYVWTDVEVLLACALHQAVRLPLRR
jgi:hypothetical protein